MDLGLRGQSLLAERIDYTVSLDFSGKYFVYIESPFSLHTPEGDFQLSPDKDPEESFEPLRGLVGQEVTEATAEESGLLTLSFQNGARIRVSPDGDYEAWTMAGPRGMKVVCMPSGELAVWSADPDEPHNG